jgi:hypothetical protein
VLFEGLFAEWLPCNEVKGGIIPSGITASGGLGALDEVLFHGRGVGCSSDIIGDSAGDLVMTVEEEGGTCAVEPCGEEANLGSVLVVYCIGVVISINIELSIWGEFVKWVLLVLMSLDMDDVNIDG